MFPSCVEFSVRFTPERTIALWSWLLEAPLWVMLGPVPPLFTKKRVPPEIFRVTFALKVSWFRVKFPRLLLESFVLLPLKLKIKLVVLLPVPTGGVSQLATVLQVFVALPRPVQV